MDQNMEDQLDDEVTISIHLSEESKSRIAATNRLANETTPHAKVTRQETLQSLAELVVNHMLESTVGVHEDAVPDLVDRVYKARAMIELKKMGYVVDQPESPKPKISFPQNLPYEMQLSIKYGVGVKHLVDQVVAESSYTESQALEFIATSLLHLWAAGEKDANLDPGGGTKL